MYHFRSVSVYLCLAALLSLTGCDPSAVGPVEDNGNYPYGSPEGEFSQGPFTFGNSLTVDSANTSAARGPGLVVVTDPQAAGHALVVNVSHQRRNR